MSPDDQGRGLVLEKDTGLKPIKPHAGRSTPHRVIQPRDEKQTRLTTYAGLSMKGLIR